MSDDTYVVVPAYNEAEVIRSTIEGLRERFSNIVVVDDGSSDDTASIVREMGVTALVHLINVGQGAALQTGITYSLGRGAAAVISFDADGQHRVSDAVDMLGELRKDECDVVLGSRFLGSAEGISGMRKLLLRAAVIFSNLTTGVKLTDAHNGLRVMSRRAAASVDLRQFRMAHATEIIQQFRDAGMRIKEYPVTVRYTEYSKAKGQRSLNAINVLLDLMIGRVFR